MQLLLILPLILIIRALAHATADRKITKRELKELERQEFLDNLLMF